MPMATRKPKRLRDRISDASARRRSEKERAGRQRHSQRLARENQRARRELPSPSGCVVAVVFCIGCVAFFISAAWGDTGPSYLTDTMRENAGLAEVPTVRPGLDLSAFEGEQREEVADVADQAPQELIDVARWTRIHLALRHDGDMAAGITAEIIDRAPHLTDGQVYEIAWAIARYCRQHEIRPALVLSLIAVESGFNVNATSPTNDYGLMQLHGRPNLRGVIGPNIQAGGEHLARNMRTAGGDERRALEFYNGGGNPPPASKRYAEKALKGVR